MKCSKCLDCKYIADDDDQTAWAHIEEFAQKHPESAVAYRMGLVKKLPCPKCNVIVVAREAIAKAEGKAE